MACKKCTPELYPAGPIRHEGHAGVRFPNGWRMVVFKDGEQIFDCYEVDVLAGRAWRYTSLTYPFDWCECGSGRISAYIDTGNFSIAEALAVEAHIEPDVILPADWPVEPWELP